MRSDYYHRNDKKRSNFVYIVAESAFFTGSFQVDNKIEWTI